MMDNDGLERLLEELLPPESAEEWDNSGWQVRLGESEIERALLALEVNEETAQEAADSDCQVIVCHHPLIFGGIISIDERMPSGRTISRLIRNGISVYACHTTFDKAEGGMNDYFGKTAGFENIRRPGEGMNFSEYIRTGDLPRPVELGKFIEKLEMRLGLPPGTVKTTGKRGKTVRTGCWCTGAGIEFMEEAMRSGADFYITGDVKYHDARRAKDSGFTVIDCGHFGSERIFPHAMAEMLDTAPVDLVLSSVELNPYE